ncbi:helix-turn-helix domain-containing protein [Listeria booriae]|uniref:helix-turn-helix domain-containing protein n=1 Tax=Listeria booriae TaxID=1552123 RepID=UPI001628839F|nr:helix-turn-helix domain containing protein [Listeria booriae]MBC1231216.1 helix-turn-helix domain containing protein [Listeria booriae]MBC2391084.1 helix-turn-helix domain containing protein [Listeria booriae]
MNHFFIQLIAEKKVRRQIKVLQKIYDAKFPITVDEIAEDLDISKRTLSRDIKDIEHSFPEQEVLELNTVYGYSIDHSHYVDDLIARISEESPLLLIVNGVFQEEFKSIDEWADELFISTSTLHRYLTHLKNILKEFKLELSLTPIAIHGEEVNIRHFFFNFFYNMNDISTISHPTEAEYELHIKLLARYDEIRKISNSSQHRRGMYWLMVVNTRIKQGHFIKINPELKKMQKQMETYKVLAQVVESLLPFFVVDSIPEDELVYMDLLTLDIFVYLGDREISGFHSKSEIEAVDDFLVKAFNTLGINKIEASDLRVFISYFRNQILLSKLTPLFQKNVYEVNQFIKGGHKALFYKWVDLLQNDPIKQVANIEYIEDVAVNLTIFTHCMTYNKNFKARERHILFTFDGPNAYLNYLATLIEKFNIKDVRITLLTNYHVTNELIEERKVDVVVCNYKEDSEALNCKVYKAERVPTENDWEQIRNIIFYMDELI